MPRLWMTLSGLFGAIGIAVAAWSTHGLPAIVAGIHTRPSVYIVPVGGSALILGWMAVAVAWWVRR